MHCLVDSQGPRTIGGGIACLGSRMHGALQRHVHPATLCVHGQRGRDPVKSDGSQDARICSRCARKDTGDTRQRVDRAAGQRQYETAETDDVRHSLETRPQVAQRFVLSFPGLPRACTTTIPPREKRAHDADLTNRHASAALGVRMPVRPSALRRRSGRGAAVRSRSA